MKRRHIHESPQMDLITGLASPLMPPLPATPYTTPRVKMPYGNPPSSVTKCPSVYSSNCLNDVDIPSPFLYHDSQHGYFPPATEVQPGWGIPYFEYAYGQALPEPDFNSYRPMTAVLKAGPDQIHRRESLGLSLCTPGSSRHKAEESRISDESHDFSTHGFPVPNEMESSTLADPTASSRLKSSTTSLVNNDQIRIPVDPEWSWAGGMPFSRHLNRSEMEQDFFFPHADDDLVYPTLPTPAYIRDAPAAHHGFSSAVQYWGSQTAPYWSLSAGSVPADTNLDEKIWLQNVSIAAASHPGSLDVGPQPVMHDHRHSVNVSTNIHDETTTLSPANSCLALVPARLYQHHFVAWAANVPVAAPFADGMILSGTANDSESPLKLFDWLVQLNTARPQASASRHESGSPSEQLTEEVVYQCCEDLSASDNEPAHGRSASRQADVHPDDEAIHNAHYSEDYASTSHYDSEIELLSQSQSQTDDGWAYWDWDTESREDIKFDTESRNDNQGSTRLATDQATEQVEKSTSMLWGILA